MAAPGFQLALAVPEESWLILSKMPLDFISCAWTAVLDSIMRSMGQIPRLMIIVGMVVRLEPAVAIKMPIVVENEGHFMELR
jgi:hypothetical protein